MYRINLLQSHPLSQFIYIVLFLVIVSCDNGSSKENYSLHPTAEVLESFEQNVTVKLSKINNGKSNLITDSELMQKIKSLGVLYGDPNQIFGSIDDVVVSEDIVFIFDRQKTKVSAFTKDGVFLNSTTSIGRGPDDLFIPIQMTKGGNSNELVLLEATGELKVLLFNPDTLFEIHTISTDFVFSPMSVCYVSGIPFVTHLTIGESKDEHYLIHQYDKNFIQKFHSFANIYPANNTLQAGVYSEGILHCNEETESIIYSFDIHPYIQSFTLAGDLIWTAKINEFEPLRYRDTPAGGGRFVVEEPKTLYMITSTVLNYGNEIVLQVEERFFYVDQEAERVEPVIHTYTFDSVNYEQTGYTTKFPLIAYLNENLLIVKKENEYPILEIYEFLR